MDAVGRRSLGLALTLLNMLLSTSGFIMQRKAHIMNEELAMELQRPAFRRPLWVIGITLYILAAVPDVWACTLIPQILYSTIGCLRLVMMSFFGHIILKEKVGPREVIGISLCLVGAVLCVWFGPGSHAGPVDTSTLFHPRVWAYACVGGGFLTALMILVHMESFGCSLPTNKLYRCALPVATSLAYGIGRAFNAELGFVQMPKDLLQEPLWLTLSAFVVIMGLLDFYLNMLAAQRMSVQIFVPIAYAFGVSLQCFQGMWVFQETKDMTQTACLVTVLGIVFALIGASVIHLCATPDAEETPRSRLRQILSEDSVKKHILQPPVIEAITGVELQ